jgi:hypothetical protein
MLRIHVRAVNDNQVDLVGYSQGAASMLSRFPQQLVRVETGGPAALLHYRLCNWSGFQDRVTR